MCINVYGQYILRIFAKYQTLVLTKISNLKVFNILHIETETEIFQMYSYNGERPWPSLSLSTVVLNTSGKIILLNEYGCRDAPCEKSWKQGNPFSNTIKDTSTIMCNPLSELCREGYA